MGVINTELSKLVADTPRPTPDEERQLVTDFQTGCVAYVVQGSTVLEFVQAVERLEKAKRALDWLVLANIPFIIDRANDFRNRPNPFTLDERVQIGVIGFIRSLYTLDYRKGRLTTYATLWVRQVIDYFLKSQQAIIKVPLHQVELYKPMTQFGEEYLAENGKKPSFGDYGKKFGISAHRAKSLLNAQLDHSSLDFVFSSTGVEAMDIFKFAETDGTEMLGEVEESVHRTEQREFIDLMLSTLTEKERNILTYVFGLDGKEPRTLETVGAMFGDLTRERVRQIKEQAITKLRLNFSDEVWSDWL